MMKKIAVVLAVVLSVILLQSAGFCGIAPDPITLATGARSLGMGRASVGLADDINSIYTNPAGLAEINRWQITSMSGQLLQEYNYLSFSGVYPIPKVGNFGLGIVNSTISGAYPTRPIADSDPSDMVYEIDPTLSTINYFNNVFLLSYGGITDNLLATSFIKPLTQKAPWLNNLSNIDYGLNFKIFSAGLSGGGLSGASGTGIELDAGIKGKTPLKWLNYGAAFQNLLPASLGGKLSFQGSNYTDGFPHVLKLGIAANVLGDENAFRSFRNQNVTILLDAIMEPTRSKVPMLFKLGAEWKPIDLLAIRAGIDEAQVGGSVANNLSAGLGVYFQGFRFDYAYHLFEGAYGIDNHFFSLSYGIFPPVKNVQKEYIKLTNPLETTITQNAQVTFAGICDVEIGSAKVKDTWLKLSGKGTFEADVPQSIGKNTVWVQGFDKKGSLLESKRRRILRLVSYPDVTPGYWVFEQTNDIGTLGIITGYPDGKFKPEGNITRAELTALLVRTRLGSQTAQPVTKSQFKDVAVTHWASSFIDFAVKSGIVLGYPDKTFRPSANITRAEGLAMIARFGGVTEEAYTPIFRDISSGHWASKIIAGSFRDGLLQFLRGKPFEANKKLTRAEAVEILFRTRPVKTLVGDLMNFDKGYGTEAPKIIATPVK